MLGALAAADALAVVPADVTRVAGRRPADVPAPARSGRTSDRRASDADRPRGLTHVRADGTAHMVDVSAKAVTARQASRAGRVLLSPRRSRRCATASSPRVTRSRSPASPASRRPSALRSWCRWPTPSPSTPSRSTSRSPTTGSTSRATVRTADRTGIEMEALTAVSVAALALVDMVKAVDKHARITDVRVTAKSGGRSGDWVEEP